MSGPVPLLAMSGRVPGMVRDATAGPAADAASSVMPTGAPRRRAGISDRSESQLRLTGQQLARPDQQATRGGISSRSALVSHGLGRHLGMPDA